MDTCYKPLAVANRFLELAQEPPKELRRPITLLKLLKLVYFAHGWNLGLTGKPLLNQQVEAWKFGPVSPPVYHAFKRYGSSPITELGEEVSLGPNDDLSQIIYSKPTLERTGSLDTFMRKIWDIYGKMTAFQLSELTHQPGTPWDQIYNKMGGSQKRGTDIPDPLIEKYFKEKLAANG